MSAGAGDGAAGASEEIPFPVAPAPWHLKGTAFWFFTYASGSSAPASLPKPFYGDLEAASNYADASKSGDFTGGLGTVMVLRYTESPVGPYDELLLIPGKFKTPTGQTKNRISRIYVSTKASVYNGRKNWNIAKTLGTFTFTDAPAGSPFPYSHINVSSPSSPDTPFFSVSLSTIPLLSTAILPSKTSWLPLDVELVTPPLPQSDDWKENAEVGTERWLKVTPGMGGKIGLFSAKGGFDDGKSLGDGVGWPKLENAWRTGIWWKDLQVEFAVAEGLEGEEGRKRK